MSSYYVTDENWYLYKVGKDELMDIVGGYADGSESRKPSTLLKRAGSIRISDIPVYDLDLLWDDQGAADETYRDLIK